MSQELQLAHKIVLTNTLIGSQLVDTCVGCSALSQANETYSLVKTVQYNCISAEAQVLTV